MVSRLRSSPTERPSSARGSARTAFARVLAPVYAVGARLDRVRGRRRRADLGRPACAIVSVGGITVGGAGKTPMAAWLAMALAERGHRVAIGSRGYRGRSDQAVVVVSDGRQGRAELVRAGDEAMVLAARTRGVPVLVGTDRLRVGHHAVALFDTGILVLDDGFQHHALARDFDLVCLDADAAIGNGRVLPAGPLREPIAALRHADALCRIGVPTSSPEEPLPEPVLRAVGADRPVFEAMREARDLVPLGGGEPFAPGGIEGEAVGLVSGLARPAGFRRLVEGLGARVVRELRFPDHHAYREPDLAPLRSPDPAEGELPSRWLTTEKDAFKIVADWTKPARVDVLRIGLKVDRADELLELIEARVEARDPTRR